jgi:hypothetical protein
VCFLSFAREAAGATAHPVFPAPSVLLEGNFMHPSGAIAPRECGFMSDVIASEAKQSVLSLRGAMDCFASLAMTVSTDLAV